MAIAEPERNPTGPVALPASIAPGPEISTIFVTNETPLRVAYTTRDGWRQLELRDRSAPTATPPDQAWTGAGVERAP